MNLNTLICCTELFSQRTRRITASVAFHAKGWDPDQHDGPAEFKAICDLIEEKGYYKKK